MHSIHLSSSHPKLSFIRRTHLSWRLVFSLLCAVWVSACGFEPISLNQNEAPHRIALAGNTDNGVVEQMREVQPVNVRFLETSDPANPQSSATNERPDLILEIGQIDTTRNVLSQTTTGITSEYRISMSVQIQAYDPLKNQKLPPTKLTTYRNQLVANGYATAEDAELERLYMDMARELANSIYYRLRAIKSAQLKNSIEYSAQPSKEDARF